MEIHQLRYFCAVVRGGSFTRAAEELGIAQPSLTQSIARLEEKFKTNLFHYVSLQASIVATKVMKWLRFAPILVLTTQAARSRNFWRMAEWLLLKLIRATKLI